MEDLARRADRELFAEGVRLAGVPGDAAEDARWDIRGELALRRATRAIFDRAHELVSSPRADEMLFGIDVLNDFGPKANFPWREETVAPLLAALRKSDDDRVARSAIAALGKFGPPEALDSVVTFATHPSGDTRLCVAHALPRFVPAGSADDHAAVQALVVLTTDRESTVRDWATFGLGRMIETDGERIRSALLARLDDPDANTRHEALVALARRHDRRALPALLRALAAKEVDLLAIEAAELLGTPEALRSLRRLAENADWTADVLDLAIRRSDPTEQQKFMHQLATFMTLVAERVPGVTCFSDLLSINSEGPKIGFTAHEWSFEHLLNRASNDPGLAASILASDIAALDQL